MLERGLLITAVLLVLGVVYVLRDSVPVEIRRLVTASRETGPAAKIPPSAAPEHASRLARTPHTKTPTSLDREAANEPVSTTVINVQIPPFPVADAIRPGMTKGEVVRRFGPPNWKATWTESQTLYEKFTYVDHQRATALLIQAGRVASIRTGIASNRLSAPEVSINWD